MIPWVEKYRPTTFEQIVLNNYNKVILDNIIKSNNIPNLLFYGPPGTGKTTTIINLINQYKKQNNIKNNDIIMHLNASDERGIETIRNNILQFVSSTGLFSDNLKFVILDEVDYMTKNAQQALKYILSMYGKNIRFILICNYISKIDKSVQDKLLKLQFNKLPSDKIVEFLHNICLQEEISISDEHLHNIQRMFHSDIRSMINYLQCNKIDIIEKQNFLRQKEFNILLLCIKNNDNTKSFEKNIYNYSKKFNIDRREVIKKLIDYIFTNEIIGYELHTTLIQKIAYCLHNSIYNTDNFIKYIFYNIKGSFTNSCST